MSRLGKTLAIAVAASDPDVVYTGFAAGEVDKSVDGGVHWARTGLLGRYQTITGIVVAPDDANTLYVSLGDKMPGPNPGGVFKSIDGGESWEQVFSTPGMAVQTSSSRAPTRRSSSSSIAATSRGAWMAGRPGRC
jgi:hypothetical protein